MTKVRLWLRCSDCGEEWDSSAVRVREEWGVEVYPKQEYCPECRCDGEIIDIESPKIILADMQ